MTGIGVRAVALRDVVRRRVFFLVEAIEKEVGALKNRGSRAFPNAFLNNSGKKRRNDS